MTYFEKDEIRAGIFMVKDGGPVFPHRSAPVRYGEPFAEVNSNLDQLKARIEKLSADLARRRK